MRMLLRNSVGLLALSLVPVIAVAGNWKPTGSLVNPRQYHTETLLSDGRVLVAGGDVGYYFTSYTSAAEVYDPAAMDSVTLVTGVWSRTGWMHEPRSGHTATLITTGSDAGKVLVAGGSMIDWSDKTTELYDPANGTWSSGNQMLEARHSPVAIALQSGKILVVGGWGENMSALNTAELYDPDAIDSLTGIRGVWSATGSMSVPRPQGHQLTLLGSGKVLATSGSEIAIAELYDPDTIDPVTGIPGVWSFAGSQGGYSFGTATKLNYGNNLEKVLLVGNSAFASLYDPANGSWTTSQHPMTTARVGHTATTFTQGNDHKEFVLVAGGVDMVTYSALASAEIYDPVGDTWSTVPQPLGTAHAYHTATPVTVGGVQRIMVTAGRNHDGYVTGVVELY